MSGYDLVRHQPEQDTEISARVKKDGDTMTGDLKMMAGSKIVTYADNNDDSVSLNIKDNDQARIRIGGTGAVSTNGLEIHGVNDKKLLRVDDRGEVYVAGVSQVYHPSNKQPMLPNLYTSNARPVDANIPVVGDGGVRALKATTTMTANKPTEGDGHILNFDWDTDAGYNSQLFIKNGNNPKIQYRSQSGGTWNNWETVYSTNNKPTPADIGAMTETEANNKFLPLAGGTVTGETNFNSKVNFKGNGVEIFHATPYIDFHFNNSNSDYTSRIIETDAGKLEVEGNLNVSGRLTSKGGTALYAGTQAPANPQVGDIWIQV